MTPLEIFAALIVALLLTACYFWKSGCSSLHLRGKIGLAEAELHAERNTLQEKELKRRFENT